MLVGSGFLGVGMFLSGLQEICFELEIGTSGSVVDVTVHVLWDLVPRMSYKDFCTALHLRAALRELK